MIDFLRTFGWLAVWGWVFYYLGSCIGYDKAVAEIRREFKNGISRW